MCALVKAIRKVGIVASGPGLGDAKNPMHIVKNVEAVGNNLEDRPSTSSSEFDVSLGQQKRVVEDPATHVEDDHRQSVDLQYYTIAETVEPQLSARATGQDNVQTGESYGGQRDQIAG